jgi:hypothetical protein
MFVESPIILPTRLQDLSFTMSSRGPDIILSTHLEDSIFYGIGYQGKSGWKFSTKERSIFNRPFLDLRRLSETSKDECSLWKFAEGLKGRPCVCITNLQIFLRTLPLQMWKKEHERLKKKKEVSSKLCKVLWQAGTRPSRMWKALHQILL